MEHMQCNKDAKMGAFMCMLLSDANFCLGIPCDICLATFYRDVKCWFVSYAGAVDNK